MGDIFQILKNEGVRVFLKRQVHKVRRKQLNTARRIRRFIFGSSYNAQNASDRYGFFRRLWAVVAVVRGRYEWVKIDVPRLKALKNVHAGAKRAFIICNGPSLNQLDLTKLKNEITFGVNAIYINFDRMSFRPTYYVVEDNLVAEDRAKEIYKLSGITKLFPFKLAYCIKRDENTIFFNHCPDDQAKLQYRFSTDISDYTCGGSTVTYTCLQIAFYLGLREVYLIGADHNYQIPEEYAQRDHNENYIIESVEDDVNHFECSYFGKGYRWHNPKVHKMEISYQNAKMFYEANGGKIFNATKGGKLEVFDRVDYDSLF